METRVINFYDKFICLASDCPNTCCRGWRITIDDDTVNRYNQEKGIEGIRLKAMMSFGEDKEVRRIVGRCTNETKEGLCRLQLKGRVDLMPEVCRVYPRRSVAIGDEEEVTFELSCPLTAKLFLENVNSINLVPYEGEAVVPVWTQDMFDEEYYNVLLEVRDKVLDFADSGLSLPETMHDLYGYFHNIHKLLIAGNMDVLNVPIEDEDAKSTSGEFAYNFYSFAIFDKIIMNDLDDGRFRFQDPLRTFIREYNKLFSDMTASEADRFFDETVTKMVKEYPAFNDKYKGYLRYYLIQALYSSYESIGCYKEYLRGMVYLMALILTDVVDYVNGRDMENVDRQVKLLNACERRFRHNVSVRKKVTHRIEEEFIKQKEGYIF